MGCYGQGTVEIPLEDFWAFTAKYQYVEDCETFYGVPRVNKDNHVIEVDYMYNSSCNPQDEVGFKDSVCKKQWDLLKQEIG